MTIIINGFIQDYMLHTKRNFHHKVFQQVSLTEQREKRPITEHIYT